MADDRLGKCKTRQKERRMLHDMGRHIDRSSEEKAVM